MEFVYKNHSLNAKEGLLVYKWKILLKRGQWSSLSYRIMNNFSLFFFIFSKFLHKDCFLPLKLEKKIIKEVLG